MEAFIEHAIEHTWISIISQMDLKWVPNGSLYEAQMDVSWVFLEFTLYVANPNSWIL